MNTSRVGRSGLELQGILTLPGSKKTVGRIEMSIFEDGDTIYFKNDRLYAVDQTRLPNEFLTLELTDSNGVADAISGLSVRGAMAIGVAGAYGVLLGALSKSEESADAIATEVERVAGLISGTRPTARNLSWACDAMRNEANSALAAGAVPEDLIVRLRERAEGIALETIETNRRIVEIGQEVVEEGAGILTHCNSGPLAALRYGTAVGIIIEAHRRGKGVHVYVDETRPLFQGSRLTEWELDGEGIPHTVIPDSAAASLFGKGKVDIVITGADRIAANGDTANKIGTFNLAVLADTHGVPFYIAAPGSTVDLDCPDGSGIVVEERDGDEVRKLGDVQITQSGAPVYNPSFDVTPAAYIDGIVTEKGILRPPYKESLGCFMNDPGISGRIVEG